jgi:hypothetical protein
MRGFFLYSQTQEGYFIETKEISIAIKNPKPIPLSILSEFSSFLILVLELKDPRYQKLNEFQLTVCPQNFIKANSSLELVFPYEFEQDSDSQITALF